MQCSTIALARKCGLKGANSSEFDPKTPHPVIDLMEEQKKVSTKGHTMRLGAYDCILEEGSNARKAYGEKKIWERHRHRFEFNSAYKDKLTKGGLRITGTNSLTGLVEIIKISYHPLVVGGQFSPELKSRPTKAHPLFREFIKAALNYRNSREKASAPQLAKSNS